MITHTHTSPEPNNKLYLGAAGPSALFAFEMGRSITLTAGDMQSRQTRTSSWSSEHLSRSNSFSSSPPFVSRLPFCAVLLIIPSFSSSLLFTDAHTLARLSALLPVHLLCHLIFSPCCVFSFLFCISSLVSASQHRTNKRTHAHTHTSFFRLCLCLPL